MIDRFLQLKYKVYSACHSVNCQASRVESHLSGYVSLCFNPLLFDTDLFNGVHHIDSVFHELCHCHFVAIKDAPDVVFLALAVTVKLRCAHVHSFFFRDSGHAVKQSMIGKHKFLKNGLVVQKLWCFFCHDSFFKINKFIY